MRPDTPGAPMNRALDLFCGAGGATRGLQLAGFQVTGVDIAPQPHYCGGRFEMGDALRFPLDGYEFIWASPVCKGYSSLRHYGNNRRLDREGAWPMQISELRRRLQALPPSVLWCIENVSRAPLETDMFLCGQMFGLPLIRHRLLETNFLWLRPPHTCARRGCTIRKEAFTITGHGGGRSPSNERMKWTIAQGKEAMGIDWMTKPELAEACPPAYAEFIGAQAQEVLRRAAQTDNKGLPDVWSWPPGAH